MPRTLALLAAAVLALPACERLFDRGAKQAGEAAEKKLKTGDFRGAASLYESALDGTPKSAEIHYRLALLYADKLGSPLDALHHFERYLDFAPTGAHAKEAKDFRKENEGKLLATLSKASPLTAEEARLRNANLALTQQLNLLRAQKAATPAPLPPGMKRGEQVQKPVPPGARTHTVVKGETLATIAKKYYKSSGRWRDIQAANFYSLEGTATIHAGMTLIIP